MIEWPRTPPRTVEELWEFIQRAFFQFRSGAEAYVVTNVSIGAAVTPVRHGLKGKVPTAAMFIPSNGTEVFSEAQQADETYVYFEASGDLTGKVVIWP